MFGSTSSLHHFKTGEWEGMRKYTFQEAYTLCEVHRRSFYNVQGDEMRSNNFGEVMVGCMDITGVVTLTQTWYESDPC